MTNFEARGGFSLASHLTEKRDSRSFAYKFEWMENVKRIFSQHLRTFNRANVLEVGSGVHNPLASLIIARHFGANFAAGIDPGTVKSDFLDHAFYVAGLCSAQMKGNLGQVTYDISKLALQDSQIFESSTIRIDNGSIEFINKSFSDIDFSRLFDLSHSNAVLEHVRDFSGFLNWLRRHSSSDSIHIHKVDFIDHSYYLLSNPLPLDAFRFLFNSCTIDDAHDCNRLRVDQMVSMIAASGFSDIRILEKWMIDFPIDEISNLDGDFIGCSIEALCTIGAVIFFRG